jgi:hypothetical protein
MTTPISSVDGVSLRRDGTWTAVMDHIKGSTGALPGGRRSTETAPPAGPSWLLSAGGSRPIEAEPSEGTPSPIYVRERVQRER